MKGFTNLLHSSYDVKSFHLTRNEHIALNNVSTFGHLLEIVIYRKLLFCNLVDTCWKRCWTLWLLIFLMWIALVITGKSSLATHKNKGSDWKLKHSQTNQSRRMVFMFLRCYVIVHYHDTSIFIPKKSRTNNRENVCLGPLCSREQPFTQLDHSYSSSCCLILAPRKKGPVILQFHIIYIRWWGQWDTSSFLHAI